MNYLVQALYIYKGDRGKLCELRGIQSQGELLLTRDQVLESVHTILTQPGTPVSFRGMCICLLFDFRKLRNFRCFPFPENSGTPMFPISGNSGLRRFSLLVIHSCISPFTCDSVVPPVSCIILVYVLRSSLCTRYILVPLLSL